jgi:hypothetical protein
MDHASTGEEDHARSGEPGDQAEGPEMGVAEESVCDARLQCDHRRMIDISPGEMPPAVNVIKLVTEQVVAEVRRDQVDGDLDCKLDSGKHNARRSGSRRKEARAACRRVEAGAADVLMTRTNPR